MSENNNNQELEVYLEPSVEINRTVSDPIGPVQDPPDNNNICPPGGC